MVTLVIHNTFCHVYSVSQMYDTADYSYILPTHRLTVYIMGILMGYCLRYAGRNYPLKSVSLVPIIDVHIL